MIIRCSDDNPVGMLEITDTFLCEYLLAAAPIERLELLVSIRALVEQLIEELVNFLFSNILL